MSNLDITIKIKEAHINGKGYDFEKVRIILDEGITEWNLYGLVHDELITLWEKAEELDVKTLSHNEQFLSGKGYIRSIEITEGKYMLVELKMK